MQVSSIEYQEIEKPVYTYSLMS